MNDLIKEKIIEYIEMNKQEIIFSSSHYVSCIDLKEELKQFFKVQYNNKKYNQQLDDLPLVEIANTLDEHVKQKYGKDYTSKIELHKKYLMFGDFIFNYIVKINKINTKSKSKQFKELIKTMFS